MELLRVSWFDPFSFLNWNRLGSQSQTFPELLGQIPLYFLFKPFSKMLEMLWNSLGQFRDTSSWFLIQSNCKICLNMCLELLGQIPGAPWANSSVFSKLFLRSTENIPWFPCANSFIFLIYKSRWTAMEHVLATPRADFLTSLFKISIRIDGNIFWVPCTKSLICSY